jgi:signal transduction histidine kinase
MLTGELQAIAPPPLVPSEAPAGTDGPLVLVVEDNVDMSRHLCRLLSAGYRTARAADGREGVDLALRLHPDLILSDGMMPRMSGEEMLLDLRSRPEMSGTPIVMLTARAGDDARVRLLREGAQDYILKPFSPEELLARVRNLLAQSQARQELERRNEELQRAREDLQRTNQELEAFCYSVSHDLRAPLRSINGFSELMLEEQAAKLDDDGRRLLNAVRANATRMGELIDDLLEFSRTGRAAMRKTRLDLARLATEALRSLDAETSGRKIQVEVDALPPASGDETLIRQVFLNLLGNAVKYTRPRDVGWIEVQGKEGEKENTYWVRDNGVGFDPEYAHKLFGVFQRLHTSSQFEGTGVGLAIVQRVIQRHGGRVWAEGSVNGGATFYFTLPRG